MSGSRSNPSGRLSPGELLAEMAWLRRLALSLAGDADGAEELVQETALRALERPPRRRQGGSLRAWLATVMRNLVRSGHRDRSRQATRTLGEAAPAVDGGGDPSVEVAERLDRLRLQRLVADAVLELEEPYRTAVVLRFEQGLSFETLAARLGLSPVAARQRVARGVSRLRARLDGEVEGGRAAWCALFLARFEPADPVPRFVEGSPPASPGTWTLTAGGLAVGTKLAIGAGVAGAAALGTLLWIAPRTSGSVARESVAGGSGPAELVAPAVAGTLAAPTRRPTSFGSAPAAGSEPSVVDPARRLAGRVVDEEGRPVAGARVEAQVLRFRGLTSWWWEEGGPVESVASTATDAEGGFELEVEPDRPHRLEARADGMGPGRVDECLAAEPVEIVLRPAATLLLEVVRKDGTPVAGAAVEGHGEPNLRFQGTTNGTGTFVVNDLATTVLRLQVEPRDLASAWATLDLAPGARTEHRVVVREGLTVVGRVVDGGTGLPLEGVTVGQGWWAGKPVRTDAEGEYELPGFTPEGVYTVVARADGYGTRQTDIPSAAAGVVRVDFELLPGIVARGRVLDAEGEPLAGARVAALGFRIEGSATQQSDSRTATTDGEGRFLLNDLRRDLPHALLVVADGHAAVTYDFPVPEPADTDFGDLRLGPGGWIRGEVVDEAGRPLPNVQVELYGANADRHRFGTLPDRDVDHRVAQRSGRSDSRGRFAFDQLAAGTYRVVAREGPQRVSRELLLGTGGTERVELVLQARLSIEGRVLGPGGEPADVVVFAEAEEGEGFSMMGTGPDGSFRLKGLSPGSYVVRAEPIGNGGDAGLWAELPGVQAGTTDLEIRMERRPLTTGTVVDEDGAPLHLVYVRAVDADGAILKSDNTDPAGRFELRLDPGRPVTLIAVPLEDGKPFYLPQDVLPERCARLEDVVRGSEGHRLVLPREP